MSSFRGISIEPTQSDIRQWYPVFELNKMLSICWQRTMVACAAGAFRLHCMEWNQYISVDSYYSLNSLYQASFISLYRAELFYRKGYIIISDGSSWLRSSKLKWATYAIVTKWINHTCNRIWLSELFRMKIVRMSVCARAHACICVADTVSVYRSL